MPPSQDLLIEHNNEAADLGWNKNYSHWWSCGKSAAFSDSLGTEDLEVIAFPCICNFKIEAQCKVIRFIFFWLLMQSTAGRQKCLCCLGFCGVAVLVTVSMMCFCWDSQIWFFCLLKMSTVHVKCDLLLSSNRDICFASGSVKISKFNQGLNINVKNRIWNMQLNYQWKNKILFRMVIPLGVLLT